MPLTISERIGYRFGLHYIHRSHKSISGCTILGGIILPDVIHIGHWLAIRYIRGCDNIISWYEIISEFTEGSVDGGKSDIQFNSSFCSTLNKFSLPHLTSHTPSGSVLSLLHLILDICEWGWQLYIPVDGQFCRQLHAPDYRLLRMHCC